MVRCIDGVVKWDISMTKLLFLVVEIRRRNEMKIVQECKEKREDIQ